jgi:hypothetical protein
VPDAAAASLINDISMIRELKCGGNVLLDHEQAGAYGVDLPQRVDHLLAPGRANAWQCFT